MDAAAKPNFAMPVGANGKRADVPCGTRRRRVEIPFVVMLINDDRHNEKMKRSFHGIYVLQWYHREQCSRFQPQRTIYTTGSETNKEAHY